MATFLIFLGIIFIFVLIGFAKFASSEHKAIKNPTDLDIVAQQLKIDKMTERGAPLHEITYEMNKLNDMMMNLMKNSSKMR